MLIYNVNRKEIKTLQTKEKIFTIKVEEKIEFYNMPHHAHPPSILVLARALCE